MASFRNWLGQEVAREHRLKPLAAFVERHAGALPAKPYRLSYEELIEGAGGPDKRALKALFGEAWSAWVALAAPDRDYAFERRDGHTLRSVRAAEAEYPKFLARLCIEDRVVGADCKDLVLKYIIENHLNIDWYTVKLKRARLYHVLFIVVSIALLLTVPLGLVFLPKLLGWLFRVGLPPADPSLVIGQITGLLTGIMGTQKAIATWLDRRQMVGTLWKTAADLKAALYGFEDTWRGKAVDETAGSPGLSDPFLQALKAGTASATQLVAAERAAYFAQFATPTYEDVGLGSTLSALMGMNTGEKGLVTAYLDPLVARQNAADTLAAATRERLDK